MIVSANGTVALGVGAALVAKRGNPAPISVLQCGRGQMTAEGP